MVCICSLLLPCPDLTLTDFRAILAKAYSVLRGSREKQDAPLDEFFQLCAPRIGIIPPDQYQQLMGWQIIWPNDGDQYKMPQVIRLFAPNLDKFPEEFTTTNLSVDNLVDYCIRAGCVKKGNNGTPRSDAQGALTMAVQPAAAVTTLVSALPATQGMVSSPPSPFMTLSQNLPVAIGEPMTEPAGQSILNEPTITIANASAYPHCRRFDPTGEFNLSFNAVEETNFEESRKWDAYNPSANASFDEMLNVDWNHFVNDDGFT